MELWNVYSIFSASLGDLFNELLFSNGFVFLVNGVPNALFVIFFVVIIYVMVWYLSIYFCLKSR